MSPALMRAYERAGVAAVFIEDQVSPKRCGHMEGKRVIPASEMVEKLKAALDARQDEALIVMARTDARAVDGLDAAIERAELYREAGADLLFVEAPLTVEEMRRVCSEIAGPCLANNVEGGKTPLLPAETLEEMGFAAVTWPVSATYAIAQALGELYATLEARRHHRGHGQPHAELRCLQRADRPARPAPARERLAERSPGSGGGLRRTGRDGLGRQAQD